jgi:hypothetical protein
MTASKREIKGPIRVGRRRSPLEDAFEWQLKAALPDKWVEREFRFHPSRKWRADFLVGEYVLVEIEGAVYRQGRHTRGAGFEADIEKYNEATIAGYSLIRGTARHVRNGQLIAWVERALKL